MLGMAARSVIYHFGQQAGSNNNYHEYKWQFSCISQATRRMSDEDNFRCEAAEITRDDDDVAAIPSGQIDKCPASNATRKNFVTSKNAASGCGNSLVNTSRTWTFFHSNCCVAATRLWARIMLRKCAVANWKESFCTLQNKAGSWCWKSFYNSKHIIVSS